MTLPIFPEYLAPGFVGGPDYAFNVVPGSGGFEDRDLLWGPQHQYQFSVQPLPLETIHEILHFHHDVRGAVYPWLLRDAGDFWVVDEFIGTGDGTETDFQAQITYGNTNPLVRIIRHLKAGTVTAKVDTVPATVASHEDGIIKLSAAPTNGASVTASFQFYVPCRFGEGRLDIQTLISETGTPSGLASLPSLSAIEVLE